jgi:serine protease Do
VSLKIDGREVNAPNELQTYVAEKHVGDVVTLLIFRDGKRTEMKVTLKPRTDTNLAANSQSEEPEEENDTEAAPSKPLTLGAVGMSVRNLSPDEKKSLELEQGVVVTDVKPFSESENRFIQRSDIIVEADRKPVRSVNDLKKIFDQRRPGDAVLLRLKRSQNQQTAFVAVQIPK